MFQHVHGVLPCNPDAVDFQFLAIHKTKVAELPRLQMTLFNNQILSFDSDTTLPEGFLGLFGDGLIVLQQGINTVLHLKFAGIVPFGFLQ